MKNWRWREGGYAYDYEVLSLGAFASETASLSVTSFASPAVGHVFTN